MTETEQSRTVQKMQYRFEDLAILILQNMPDMSTEQLSTILQYIEFTRCAYLKPVFEYCKAFYEQNDKMPDEDYLTIQFENVLYDTQIPYHPQLIDDFIRVLTTESVAVQSQQALQQGNFKKAANIIQGAEKSSSAPILSMKDVLKLWKENRKEFSFGLKTGVPELDDLYKFLGYKTLNVVAAPPANFKTTMAISMAMYALLNQDHNIVYITLEDTSETIYHDFLAAFAGTQGINITAEEIKRYLLPENKIPLFEDLVSKWDEMVGDRLKVLSARECDSFTPAVISRKLDEIYKSWNNKLDAVFVDHFNIMNDPIPGMQLQGPQLAKYYVRFMTNLSISFGHKGFILVGLAQINREGQLKLEKGKELSGAELADTSELHRSATTVTSLYADDTDRINGILRIKNIKNRLGPQGANYMVPIYPEQFKVGANQQAIKSMSVEQFEQLAQTVPVQTQTSVQEQQLNSLISSFGATPVNT